MRSFSTLVLTMRALEISKEKLENFPKNFPSLVFPRIPIPLVSELAIVSRTACVWGGCSCPFLIFHRRPVLFEPYLFLPLPYFSRLISDCHLMFFLLQRQQNFLSTLQAAFLINGIQTNCHSCSVCISCCWGNHSLLPLGCACTNQVPGVRFLVFSWGILPQK